MSHVEDQDSLSIKPSQEDIEFRQRSAPSNRTTSTPASAPAPLEPEVKAPWLLYLGVAALVGFAGWQYWALQQAEEKLALQDQDLLMLAKSVKGLEDKLNVTDESASSSLTALQATIKTHDSEIKKLWDVSNKRNKSWIQTLQKEQKQNDTALSQLKKQSNQSKAADKKLTASIKGLDKKIEDVRESTGASDAQMLALRAEIEALQSESNKVPQSVSKRLDDIDKALSAIDATRINQAKNITDIKNELTALKQQVKPETQTGSGIIAQ